MSQPDYPLFSKKCQRNSRGTYNFERTKEFHLAEKWFEERKEAKKDSRPPSPMVQSPPPIKVTPQIKGPPPGLPKPISKNIASCFKCNKIQTNPLMVACCVSCFCLSCTFFQAELYNRCYKCKAVIDMNRYKEYDDLDLVIPSYEDFDYVSPDDPVSLTNIPLNIEKNTSRKLNIFAEEFKPRVNQEELQKNIIENQLMMNYMYFYNMMLACLQSQAV
jgi:hypothetical protein